MKFIFNKPNHTALVDGSLLLVILLCRLAESLARILVSVVILRKVNGNCIQFVIVLFNDCTDVLWLNCCTLSPLCGRLRSFGDEYSPSEEDLLSAIDNMGEMNFAMEVQSHQKDIDSNQIGKFNEL